MLILAIVFNCFINIIIFDSVRFGAFPVSCAPVHKTLKSHTKVIQAFTTDWKQGGVGSN
jgi:hypothetical protein